MYSRTRAAFSLGLIFLITEINPFLIVSPLPHYYEFIHSDWWRQGLFPVMYELQWWFALIFLGDFLGILALGSFLTHVLIITHLGTQLEPSADLQSFSIGQLSFFWYTALWTVAAFSSLSSHPSPQSRRLPGHSWFPCPCCSLF